LAAQKADGVKNCIPAGGEGQNTAPIAVFRLRHTWCKLRCMELHQRCFSCAVMGFLAAWSPTLAKPPSANPEMATAVEPAAFPPLPQPKLSPLEGADEAENRRKVAARISELGDAVAKADGPLAKAEHSLALANLILARELEAVCTARFLRITRDNDAEEGGAARAAATRAATLIDDARAALTAAETPEAPDEAAARQRELHQHAQTLAAFAGALAAYLQLDNTDAAHSPRRAASDLSPLLEDADADVANAAAFWRACLRAMDADPEAALSALDPVVSDLPTEGARYAFFSRLLRCRLLTARGAESTSLALLMQVEERVNDWFKAESDRQEAMRTIAFVQMQVLRSWHDRLPPEQSQERSWCAGRVARLRDDYFAAPDSAPVMRLGEAIPILVPSAN